MLHNAKKSTFPECCDLLEVYYNGPLEYTYESIYGYYVRQADLINGRPWYKNDGKSIWWDDDNRDYWNLGKTTEKGSSIGFAYLDNDGSCLPKIPNQNWKIFRIPEDPWISAGNNVKVRCGYKPEGK